MPSVVLIQDVLPLFCPPLEINCVAFTWNVVFPVSQGNAVINIIAGAIITDSCHTAVYVGMRPVVPKPALIAGLLVTPAASTCVNIEHLCVSSVLSMPQMYFFNMKN